MIDSFSGKTCLIFVSVFLFATLNLLRFRTSPTFSFRRRPAACEPLDGIQTGKVVGYEPYFVPDAGCLRAVDAAVARACLRGRTIWFVGNSVARGFAFELATRVYGAEVVDRVLQKFLCEDRLLPCSIYSSPEVDIRFFWVQTFSPDSSHYSYPDRCTSRNQDECLGEMFVASKPRDILAFLIGHDDAVHAGSSGPAAIDTHVRADALKWKASLSKNWHGEFNNIFRIRASPLSDESLGGDDTMTNFNIPIVNAAADSAFDDAPWHTIDQYGINMAAERRSVYYQDHIHFAGNLSYVPSIVILNSVCDNF